MTFIVFEGGEGVGKSTQIARVSAWMEREGRAHRVAREPGGTALGEAVRALVLDRPDLRMPAETELLLILAARATFVRDVVRPALDRGEIVVADRFDLSTFAYQGHGRGLDLDEVRRLNAFATGGLRPDLYVILDVSVAEGRARQAGRGRAADRMEREDDAFRERVRRAYLELAAGEPRARIVAAGGTPDAVWERVRTVLEAELPETFPRSRH